MPSVSLQDKEHGRTWRIDTTPGMMGYTFAVHIEPHEEPVGKGWCEGDSDDAESLLAGFMMAMDATPVLTEYVGMLHDKDKHIESIVEGCTPIQADITTVHVLYHGRSLCEFHPGLPADWPVGHTWVGINSKDKVEATCSDCRDVLREASEL